MNQPAEYYSPTEEIDLTEIIRKLIQFLRTNLKLLLLFVLMGIALGVLAYFMLPRRYNVRMIADSRLLSSQEVTNLVDSWNELLGDREYTLLSRKLNVPLEVVTSVAALQATSAATSVEGANAKDVFAIEAVVFDNDRVDALQKGIIYYLENSPYVQERITAEKRRMNALKNRLQGEIAQLDSVKLSLQSLIRRGGNASNAFIAEPGSINAQIVTLYGQLLGIEENLLFMENIQVISGFDRREHADFPKLPPCVLVGAVVGFVIALVVTFLRSLKLG